MSQKDDKFTPIEAIGKVKLIQRLTKNDMLTGAENGFKISLPDNVLGVFSPITLDEGVHFNLVYTPLIHLGYKSVIAAISGLYSQNATPKGIIIHLSVSNKLYVEHLDNLFEGIHKACDRYHVQISGCNLTSSITGMSIDITAIGEVTKEKNVSEGDAKPNDLLCVTGDLGGAYMGLQILERERSVFESSGAQPQLEKYKYIIERQLKPEAKKEIIDFFESEKIKPGSMKLITEGLASEILHLCHKSDCGSKIFAEKIPIDAETSRTAEEMNLEPLTCALNGGEDFELLFTIPASEYKTVSANPDIHIIGHLTSDKNSNLLIFESGAEIPIKAQGWNNE